MKRIFRLSESRPDPARDVDDEIRFHLEMRTQEFIERGLSAEAARRAAQDSFGDIDAIEAECRDVRGRRTRERARRDRVHGLAMDIAFALRSLRKHKGFTAAAVLTLALGIGANTAMFSVVNGVLLQPLPYRQPDRLVRLHLDGLDYAGTFLQFRERVKTMDVAAFSEQELSLTGSGEPIQLQGAQVSSNFFSTLGTDALIGRGFLPDETQPGHSDVVVLGEALWRARFGGDPAIVCQQVDLDGTSRTVVGVMPSSVRYPNTTIQLWVPLVLDPANRVAIWSTGAFMIARLHHGITLTQACAEVAALAPQMLGLFPWSMPAEYGRNATALPLQADIVGSVRPMLLILLGAVGFVLLIACVNVANLMLVRTAARKRELAIRTALGAGAGRLVRQLLTESVLLALLGGAVGLLLAFLGVQMLTAVLPSDTPRFAAIGIDGRVLTVTFVVALVTGLAFGLVPALRAGRSDAQTALKDGGRGSSAGAERRRLNNLLVATEVALAVVLVTGAGLLVRSFWQLLQVDPGFRTEHLISATVAPPTFRYQTDASRRQFYEQLLQRVDALPGVGMAAVTTNLPFTGRNYISVFIVEGRPDPRRTGNWPLADVFATVSPDYLRTMGLRLVRGRTFTEADRAGAPPVVLINESLAKKYWPNDDPIGKRIAGPSGTDWATIVGIVADAKHDQLNESAKGALYRPLLQSHIDAPMSVVVRTSTEPHAFAANLRSMVASVDADTPVSDIRTMPDLISSSLARPRFAMALLAAFGTLALALGAVGIYGVLASVVGERTHEIGVRMALGARPADVMRMVIGQGARLTLAGILVGLIGSVAVTRLLASLLYGVGAIDPVTFVTVPIVLIGVGFAASYLPARRAAHVDPMEALREL